MDIPSPRLALIQELFETYRQRYLNRDPLLLNDFSENFSGYTGCGNFLVHDLAQWQTVTRTDFIQIPDPIHWEILDLHLQDLAEDVVAVVALFHIHLPLNTGFLPKETARLTLIFRREGEAWKVAHSGISLPYQVQPSGDEVYPLQNLTKRNRLLEGEVAARTAELEEANRKLKTLSQTDGLTGIANRRQFDIWLAQEWNRARRLNSALTLIMIDVDYFKLYNDRYGHLSGDHCLQELARLLADHARRCGDLAARYGGEEFALLLPNIHPMQALFIGQHFVQALSALALPHTDSPEGLITASAGIAYLIPNAHNTPAMLIEQADAALYRAKQTGRNRVEMAAT